MVAVQPVERQCPGAQSAVARNLHRAYGGGLAPLMLIPCHPLISCPYAQRR